MNLRPFSFVFLALALTTLASWGCSTEFEVYAPEKEIRAVFCILNPEDSVQYLRIAKGYQVRGDAVAYAAETDLSLQGLNITLTGNGKTYTAVEVPNRPKEPGLFFPSHTVYKFVTDGSGPGHEPIVHGQTYTLKVGTEGAPGYVTGTTIVPEQPKIQGDLNIQSGAGTTKCLPRVALDKAYFMEMKKQTSQPVSYEVRVYFYFEKNGIPDTLMWGPSDLFQENKGCNQGSGAVCFSWGERELLGYFAKYMPTENGVVYTYDSKDSCVINNTLLDSLPKSLKFELTVVDEGLSNYMTVNDPKILDLSGTRPEYTNLSGNVITLGVFGSIAKDRKYAIMKDCPEWLLGLNGQTQPLGCEP